VIFSSPRFLAFLIVLLIVMALRWPRTVQKRILLVASCLFYAAWDYRYLGLLASISIIDYMAASQIDRSTVQRTRKLWLLLSITSNLGLLAYFKYYNFFANSLRGPLASVGWHVPNLDILLPAGISFYTFKTMSYTIDVYRRELKPEKNLLDYAMFVTFFPELIAGPIVRASVFLPQMVRDIRPTLHRIRVGLSIFLVGMTKKLLLADPLSSVADPIFRDPALYSGATLIGGVLAYSMQIYCDFSGYSDMAIGVAKMFGFDLPRNFHMPYLSADITEFWRRWHITLSSWLRDYLYIPLGGNRKGKRRTYLNLMITMALGGLWHGASWNFVAWGLLHGTALAAHKLFRDLRGGKPALPRIIGIPATFVFVSLCWIPFRASSFAITRTILTRMFTLAVGAPWLSTALLLCVPVVAVGHALGVTFERVAQGKQIDGLVARALALFGIELTSDPISGYYAVFGWATVGGVFLTVFWALIIFLFAPTHTSPFIYFQF
jgi:alginate O-acetyltransferase complex protein AlgI